MWSTVWRPAPNPEVEGAELTQQEIPEQFDWIGNARRSPKAMQGLVASNSPTQFTVFEDIVGTIELCEVAVYTPLGTLLRRIPLLVMLSSAQYAVASPPLQVDEVPIADSKSAAILEWTRLLSNDILNTLLQVFGAASYVSPGALRHWKRLVYYLGLDELLFTYGLREPPIESAGPLLLSRVGVGTSIRIERDRATIRWLFDRDAAVLPLDCGDLTGFHGLQPGAWFTCDRLQHQVTGRYVWLRNVKPSPELQSLSEGDVGRRVLDKLVGEFSKAGTSWRDWFSPYLVEDHRLLLTMVVRSQSVEANPQHLPALTPGKMYRIAFFPVGCNEPAVCFGNVWMPESGSPVSIQVGLELFAPSSLGELWDRATYCLWATLEKRRTEQLAELVVTAYCQDRIVTYKSSPEGPTDISPNELIAWHDLEYRVLVEQQEATPLVMVVFSSCGFRFSLEFFPSEKEIQPRCSFACSHADADVFQLVSTEILGVVERYLKPAAVYAELCTWLSSLPRSENE